jgi:multicomponent Na+:H+ antiporter subunit D
VSRVLLLLPLLVPLLTAIVTLLAARRRRVQRALGVGGMAGLFASGVALLNAVWRDGILVTQAGNWPAPFGITLVADLLSALLVALTGLMGLAVAVYSLADIDERREAFGYYPLLHLLLMGVCGAFLTGDLFNLFVWFEVMLMASFVLLALGGERAQMEGAIKYVTLNLVSSVIFLTAVGILYSVAGTLNMADLARRLPDAASPGLVTALATLFLVAFGVKAAFFPFFFWLPASYHTPPVAVSAIFAGLLTKVGVYALIRAFGLIFVHDTGYTHPLILFLAVATMITGGLGAVAQNELRRILSFLIISHIGVAVLGLGFLTRRGLAGTVFYLLEDIVVLTTLFLMSGVIRRLGGSFDLPRLGGLFRARPALAALFLIPALSLSGIPPLSGFFAKLALLRAGLEIGQYAVVAAALAVSVLTLFSMTKIWAEAFWRPLPEDLERLSGAAASGAPPARGPLAQLVAPIAALAALTVLMGLLAEPVYRVSERAADQLLDRDGYIRAVLGPSEGGR